MKQRKVTPNLPVMNCNGVRVEASDPRQRGGNYGGADCVHVVNVYEFKSEHELRAWLGDAAEGFVLRSDTVVLVKDEHGGVCQYTATEWHDFVARIVTGKLEHIAMA